MDKVCCILDMDEKYAVRVGACFNNRHVFPFMMQAFSSVDEYISCAMVNEVVLLFVDDEMYDAVKGVPAGQIIRLCEQPMLFEGSAEPVVAKFQAGDNIIRDVLCLYKGQISAACRTKNGQVEGVCAKQGKGILSTSCDGWFQVIAFHDLFQKFADGWIIIHNQYFI